MARWTRALLGAVAVAQATAMAQDVEAEGAIAGVLARARQSIAQAANAAKQYTQVAERASELGYAARDYQNSALGACSGGRAVLFLECRSSSRACRNGSTSLDLFQRRSVGAVGTSACSLRRGSRASFGAAS